MSSGRGVQAPAAYSRKACTSTQPNVVFSLLTRFYVLLQAYASLRFKPWGRWKLTTTRSS